MPTPSTSPEAPPPAPATVYELGGETVVVLKARKAVELEIADGNTYHVHATPGEIRLVGPVESASVLA